jgi:hypothetical protein
MPIYKIIWCYIPEHNLEVHIINYNYNLYERFKACVHQHSCPHPPSHTEGFRNISESKRLFMALRVCYSLSCKLCGRRVLCVQRDLWYGDSGSPHMFKLFHSSGSHWLPPTVARFRFQVMWDLWWTKWYNVGFAPSTSVSLAKNSLIILSLLLYGLNTDSVVK